MSQLLSDLVQIELGNDGVDYVEGSLRRGTGLCRKASRLPLKVGHAFALVPSGTSVDRAKSFEVGGLMAWRESMGWLADHIEALRHNNPVQTTILQDVWGPKPTDAIASCNRSSKFFDDENTYYFSEFGQADIRAIDREISSFLLVGFVVRLSIRAAGLPDDRIVHKDFIDKLARSTEEIFVTAYDREGLVLWRR